MTTASPPRVEAHPWPARNWPKAGHLVVSTVDLVAVIDCAREVITLHTGVRGPWDEPMRQEPLPLIIGKGSWPRRGQEWTCVVNTPWSGPQEFDTGFVDEVTHVRLTG